jgi:hypothetical protein
MKKKKVVIPAMMLRSGSMHEQLCHTGDPSKWTCWCGKLEYEEMLKAKSALSQDKKEE